MRGLNSTGWAVPELPANLRPRVWPGQVPLSRKGALCSDGAQQDLKPKSTTGPDGFTDGLWLREWMLLAVEESFARTPAAGQRVDLGGQN